MLRFLRINFFNLICLTILCFSLQSCVKNNPNPSWLEISAWQITSNPNATQNLGDLSLSNFTEAWVYIDDQVLGVFELPVKIPVLKEGQVNLKIYPAVKNNGISATKKIYPFTQFYESNIVLVKDETVSINATSQYYAETKAYLEDFEDTFSDIENSPVTTNMIQIANDPSIGHSGRYGWIHLDSNNPSWVGYTNTQISLPRGAEVYLEIDYRNTNGLLLGLISVSSQGTQPNPYILLNSQEVGSDKWKKIYIDLREIISNSPADAYFEISFECVLPEGATSADIYIDNIRVVHF